MARTKKFLDIIFLRILTVLSLMYQHKQKTSFVFIKHLIRHVAYFSLPDYELKNSSQLALKNKVLKQKF